MSFNAKREDVSYGLTNALQKIYPARVIAKRAPKTRDIAELGTVWVNKTTAATWVCGRVASGLATWSPLTANAGTTVPIGNLVVSTGDLSVTLGQAFINGDITTNGGISAGGNIACAGFLSTGVVLLSGAVTALSSISALGSILGLSLGASGDAVGVAGQTIMTNATETTLDTGELTINGTTGNAGSNTGFLKFYLGATPIWIPFFADIAP